MIEVPGLRLTDYVGNQTVKTDSHTTSSTVSNGVPLPAGVYVVSFETQVATSGAFNTIATSWFDIP
jgi:hypothetical protein